MLARTTRFTNNTNTPLQVTMVGRDILHGMMVHQRLEARTMPLIAACLLH